MYSIIQMVIPLANTSSRALEKLSLGADFVLYIYYRQFIKLGIVYNV